jgi:hypothetical protein
MEVLGRRQKKKRDGGLVKSLKDPPFSTKDIVAHAICLISISMLEQIVLEFELSRWLETYLFCN